MDNTGAVKRELLNILSELESAIVEGGEAAAAAFQSFTHESYIFTSAAGLVSDRNQLISALLSGNVSFSSYSMSDIEVRAYGSFAVAIGRAEGVGTNPGGESFIGSYRFTSTWILDQGWKLVAWQATSTRTT